MAYISLDDSLDDYFVFASFAENYDTNFKWPEGAEVIQQHGDAVIVRNQNVVSALFIENGMGDNCHFWEGSLEERIILAKKHINSQFREHDLIFLPGDRIIKGHKTSVIVDQAGKLAVVDPVSKSRFPAEFSKSFFDSDRGLREYTFEEQCKAAEDHAERLHEHQSKQGKFNWLNEFREGLGLPPLSESEDKKKGLRF